MHLGPERQEWTTQAPPAPPSHPSDDDRRPAHRLLEREREIAAALRKLAQALAAAGEVAGRLPAADPRRRRLAQKLKPLYRRLGSMNADWFAALVLEFSDLQEEPGCDPAARRRASDFLDLLQTALGRLRKRAVALAKRLR
jgi:hypothetical protein